MPFRPRGRRPRSPRAADLAAPNAERVRDRRQHEARVTQRRKRHPPDAVRESIRSLGGRLQREARLADPARPSQGQQADVRYAKQAHAHRVAPARDPGTPWQEWAGSFGAGSSAAGSRRPRAGRSARAPTGPSADAHQGRATPRAHKRSRGGRDQHLPAVAAGGDPGGSVHIDSDVTLLAQVRRPRMDAHPHPNRPVAQSLKCFGGRPQSARAVGKATKNASPCVSTSTP